MSAVRTGAGYTPTDPQHVATKGYTDARTPKTTVSSTAPSGPAVGDVWIDTSGS